MSGCFTLGLRSGSRRVDDHGQVVGPGNARRAFPADALRDDAEVLGADRHVEPLDGLLRETTVFFSSAMNALTLSKSLTKVLAFCGQTSRHVPQR